MYILYRPTLNLCIKHRIAARAVALRYAGGSGFGRPSSGHRQLDLDRDTAGTLKKRTVDPSARVNPNYSYI